MNRPAQEWIKSSTPDGIPPQDEESPYIPFSYGEVADIIDTVREAQASMLGADVNTMMRHYVTMLRRHIVSDSDIVELCQQIYQSHRDAIDLIIEHKPDLRKDLADYLADLVRNQPDLMLIRDTKSYVDFVLRQWQEIPEFNLGNGWAGTSAGLSVEFANGQNQLNLYLSLGSVEDEDKYVREAIFNCAHSNRDVFAGCRPKLYPKWSYLYKMPLLRRKDYEDSSIDDLAQVIKPKWDHFLQNILPQLHHHLTQISFS